TLRVIVGNGTGDRLIGAADPAVPPAWRPGTHDVAYVTPHGTMRVVDVDSGEALLPRRADVTRLRAAIRPGGGPDARIEARNGRSVVLVGRRQVFAGAGRFGTL